MNQTNLDNVDKALEKMEKDESAKIKEEQSNPNNQKHLEEMK